MTQQSIRNDFHSFVAESLANDILYKRANYYYFLGKVDTWGTGDIPPTNAIPNTKQYDDLIRGDMLYLKRINPADVSLVAKKHLWVEEKIFDQWDHTKDLRGKPFYCVNSDGNVYKCLHNANGSPSLNEPTGQSFFVFKTADGYIWKYMYAIPPFKQNKFASIEFIPVQQALSDSFYNQGAIDEVSIVEPGTGYADVQLTLLQLSGTTAGSGASGNIVVGPLGEILSVTMFNGGSGYTLGAKIDLATSTGSGAVLTPVIDAGVITGVTIEKAGIGYAPTDTISFRVGGAQLVPHISRIDGSIVGVTIVDPGIGYVSAPTITIVDAEDVNVGSGKYGNPSAVLKAIEHEGKIVAVTIEDPGVNYRSDTSTQIIVQGDGEDAEFSPVVYGGKIVAIVIENRGRNYAYAKLSVVGTGVGAVLNVGVGQSDFTSNQSIVEQTAVDGAIYSIVVSNKGQNYSSNTTVTVEGTGAGCTAVPVISGGRVEAINVTNYGEGYNQSRIIITDPTRPSYLGYTDAVAYACHTPQGGHGSRAPNELFADTVAINTTLVRDSDLDMIQQDFRTFGIIRNPFSYSANSFFSGETNILTYKFRFATTDNLQVDETLINGINKYKVVAFDFITKVVLLQQIGESHTLPVGKFLTESMDGREYQIVSLDSTPSVDKFSGELLYASYENPFSFTEGQIVTIKTFIRL